MSFLNKTNCNKPAIIAVIVLIIIAVIYVASSNKKSHNNIRPEIETGQEIKPSGLDKNMKVSNVEDVEKVVEKWIEANPEAIIKSVSEMQRKAMEKQTADAQKNISEKKAELFEDKSSPVFNAKDYNVSIVEFFDYNCGYCKKAQATIEKLLKEDEKIRFIYKEFPILGNASVELAKVALAVNMTSPGSYPKFHDAVMKSSAKNTEDAIKIAVEIGVNKDQLKKTLDSKKSEIDAIIAANHELGGIIGINGTPDFIIGEELIPGAVDIGTIKQKIAELRSKK
jgi:protein-disulfide isomerase